MIKLLITGDFSPRERVQRLFEQGQGLNVFPELGNVISDCDYSITNFETVVKGEEDKGIEKFGCHLGCDIHAVDILRRLGFNAVTLANNHFMDYGENAMAGTIKSFEESSIDYVGAGNNLSQASSVLTKDINGKRIAIINACEHEFSIATKTTPGCNPIDPINTSRQIWKAKSEADFVVLITHGGVEHYQYPTPRMVELYRLFVESGADAVVNHHQHCFCGYEIYNGKPIFYGLGNLCFDSAQDIKLRHKTFNYGFMVKLALEQYNIGFELIPYEQCYLNPVVRLFEKDSEGYVAFENQIANLNMAIANEEVIRTSFEEIAAKKRDYAYRFLLPYSSKFLQALAERGLIPSFITRRRLLVAYHRLNCDTHREILMSNISRDTTK